MQTSSSEKLITAFTWFMKHSSGSHQLLLNSISSRNHEKLDTIQRILHNLLVFEHSRPIKEVNWEYIFLHSSFLYRLFGFLTVADAYRIIPSLSTGIYEAFGIWIPQPSISHVYRIGRNRDRENLNKFDSSGNSFQILQIMRSPSDTNSMLSGYSTSKEGARDDIECGVVINGVREYYLFIDFFGRRVEVFLASSDIQQVLLFRSADLAKRLSCPTNKVCFSFLE